MKSIDMSKMKQNKVVIASAQPVHAQEIMKKLFCIILGKSLSLWGTACGRA